MEEVKPTKIINKERKAENKVSRSHVHHHHPKPSRMPQILTCIIMGQLSIMIFILAFKNIEQGNKEIFTLIIGNLISAFLMACSFWYSKKDQMQPRLNTYSDDQGIHQDRI